MGGIEGNQTLVISDVFYSPQNKRILIALHRSCLENNDGALMACYELDPPSLSDSVSPAAI